VKRLELVLTLPVAKSTKGMTPEGFPQDPFGKGKGVLCRGSTEDLWVESRSDRSTDPLAFAER